MPEIFLKGDPTQRREVSQEAANQLYASGEWAFAPDQKLYLADPNGETFAIDSSQADSFLSPAQAGEKPGFESTDSILRRAEKKRDIDEYVSGASNKLLMGMEAVGRGLSLGATDILFHGPGTALRRQESGPVGTGLELAGALAPALLTGGASAEASGAEAAAGLISKGTAATVAGAEAGTEVAAPGLTSRLLMNTPAGLAIRAGEATKLAVAGRVAGLAETGLLGRAAAAAAPAIAQGIVEGAIYGGGEGASEVSLSKDPLTVESVFSAVGGNALHGALAGGALGGALVAGGKLLTAISERANAKLEQTLSSVERRNLENTIGEKTDPRFKAAYKEAQAAHEREMLDLQEKLAVENARQRNAAWEEGGGAKLGREGMETAPLGDSEAKVREGFAKERKAVEDQIALKESTLADLDANARRDIHERYGYKDPKLDPEVLRLGSQFAEQLQGVHQTLGRANKNLQIISDLTGSTRALKDWKQDYAEFKYVFTDEGKLIKDPGRLAELLGNPDNRQLLGDVERRAASTYEDMTGQKVHFDDWLASSQITDEFLNAAGMANSPEREKLAQQMFDKQNSIVDRDAKIARDELMRSGADSLQEIAQREEVAVRQLQEGVAPLPPVDQPKLDALAEKIEALKGKDISKEVQAALGKQLDASANAAAAAGLNLSMADKIAIAASLGVHLDVVPKESLAAKVIQWFTIGKLLNGHGPRSLAMAILGGLVRRGGTIEQGVERGLSRAGRAGMRGLAQDLGRGGARRLQDAQVSFLQLVDTNINRFLQVGKMVRPAVLPSTLKILNGTSFLGEPGEHKVHGTMLEAYRARSKELSMIMANPKLLQKPVSQRLGAVDFADPQFSAQAQKLAMMRVEFLHSKMPKNPGLGVFGQMDDYVASDTEIAKWARYIRGIDAPAETIGDMAKGHLSNEQVEAMQTVLPSLHSEIVGKMVDQATDGKPLSHQQRGQLSILIQGPVDFTQKTDFGMAMQANFPPPSPEAPPPASQVNMGRLNPNAFGEPTPSDRMQQ